MGKNVRLANIYIKIYNKQPLMMDDLAFLAKYDPECFEKTCHNLVYHEPEVKKLMKPGQMKTEEPDRTEGQQTAEMEESVQDRKAESPAEHVMEEAAAEQTEPSKEALQEPQEASGENLQTSGTQTSEIIHALLENLKKMEGEDIELQKLSLDHVKNLLGSLYMEMMFPHNDRYPSFDMAEAEEYTTFNRKA